jgi:hypothetical protein
MNGATVNTTSAAARNFELPVSVLQRLSARAVRRRAAAEELTQCLLDARLKELFWGISESTLLNEASDRIDAVLAAAANASEPTPLFVQPAVPLHEELPIAC